VQQTSLGRVFCGYNELPSLKELDGKCSASELCLGVHLRIHLLDEEGLLRKAMRFSS